MRYFSDKQFGGERKAFKAAEAKLAEMKELLEKAPRRDGKLAKTAVKKGQALLKA